MVWVLQYLGEFMKTTAKYIIIALGLMIHLPIFAVEEEDIKWLDQQIKAFQIRKEKTYPHHMGFLEEKNEGNKKIVSIGNIPHDFNDEGFIKSIPKKHLDLTVGINRTFYPADLKSAQNSKNYFRKYFLFDSFFIKNANEASFLYFMQNEDKRPFAKKIPVNINGLLSQNQLLSKLGYFGVVIGKKEHQVAVASIKNLLKKESQGIIVKLSEQSTFVKQSLNIEAIALINILFTKGDFGVFDVSLHDSSQSIQIGAKVILLD